MTDPPRRRPRRRNDRPTTDGPTMGDHPELEANEAQRPAPGKPPRRANMLSPLLMLVGGIVAFVLLLAIILVVT